MMSWHVSPDWLLSDFPNRPSPPRSWVQVHSTIDRPPADPNQPLWIRFWHHDVDDPSSNQPPVDDEWFYTDNRALGGWQMAGQGGGIYSEVPVSATGQAACVFGVSPQPGDNFRVNAQIVGEGMYGIRVPQGVSNGRIVRSDGQTLRSQEVTAMLTVWRRFHVERDSMVAMVEAEDYVKGYVRAVSPSGSGWQVTVEGSGGDSVTVVNRFLTGVMRDDVAGTTYSVLWNQGMTSGWFTAGVAGAGAPTLGRAVKFYDDDFDLTKNPPCRRPNLLPGLPDVSLAQSLFRTAYVETDDEGGTWNQTNKKFYAYVTGPLPAWRDWRSKGRSLYWIGYALASFQYSEDLCWDPDTGTANLGSTGLRLTGACVFYESIRDMGYYTERSSVSAHELGHHLTGDGWHASIASQVSALDQSQPKRRFQISRTIRPEDGFYIGSGSAVLVGNLPNRMAGTLSSYANGNGVCWLTLQADLPAAPQIGQACEVCSKSLMSPTLSGSDDVLCPAEISRIRSNSESPLY